MPYSVAFNDRTTVTITDEQATKLMALQASVKKPDYVSINDEQYKLSKIDKITKVRAEPTTQNMLPAGSKRHDKSIHKTIYQLYMKELQKPSRRGWEEFRQTAYDYLYSKDPNWCDNRKGTCVCGKQITQEQVTRVMEIMRS